MQKLLSMLAAMLILSGCVTKMNIEQGNVLTDEMMHKLHNGMSQDQVQDLLGTPVLMNTFDDDRMDYVYTYKPGRGEMTEKYVTLIFRHHRLVKIEGNMYSTFMR